MTADASVVMIICSVSAMLTGMALRRLVPGRTHLSGMADVMFLGGFYFSVLQAFGIIAVVLWKLLG